MSTSSESKPISMIARVVCGTERGTAFFISSEIAVTSAHVCIEHLLDGTPIQLLVGKLVLSAVAAPIAVPASEDIIFLKLEESVDAGLVLPLAAMSLPKDAEWATYGFPRLRGEQGTSVSGVVRRRLRTSDATWDTELEVRNGTLADYEGLSGAPVMVAGRVRGMLQKQLPGALGAISCLRIRQLLDDAGVPYEDPGNDAGIPLRLSKALSRILSNRATQGEIEDAALSGGRGYIVVFGSPGCGKTMICAGFRPSVDRLRVLGRYFVGGEGDEMGLSRGYFGKAAVFCTSSPCPVVTPRRRCGRPPS